MTFRPAMKLKPVGAKAWIASGSITPPRERERPRAGFSGAWFVLVVAGLVMLAVAAELMR